MKVALKEIMQAGTQEQSPVSMEISKMLLGTVAFVSILVGVWGIVGFVSGMVTEGGPFSLIGAWFRAVLGL